MTSPATTTPPPDSPAISSRWLRWTAAWSVRDKLTVLVVGVLTANAALLLAFFPARMNAAAQASMRGRAREIAQVLALNVAPGVEFADATQGDPEVSRELAALAAVQDASYAVVRSADGRVIGTWHPERAPSPLPELDESETQGLLHAVAPIPLRAAAPARLNVGFSIARLEGERRANTLWAALFASALLAVGLAVALALGRTLVRPLTRMASIAQLISKGELGEAERQIGGADLVRLTAARELEGGDELERLWTSFARMVISLRETNAVLQDSVRLLSESVAHASEAIDGQAQMIDHQAAALQETHVTAQEIRQTSQLTAQRADEILRDAERAEAVGRSGEATIVGSLDGMKQILEHVNQVSQRIEELSEQTQQIGRITETVKDLADQSNMLALNAAIEAVRSGEHGKGFAIVAREIRSLADQSIQATGHVRTILGDVGGAATAAVKFTQKGAAELEQNFRQMRASGENLRELAGIVSASSGAVRQIVATVNQQGAGVAQVFSAVLQLQGMMDETQRRLETTQQSVRVVRDVAARVMDVSRRYQS